MIMSGAKKIGPVFDDQINAKIQRKFDLIFTDTNSHNAIFSNENNDSEFNDVINFDTEETVMANNGGSNKNEKTKPAIGLDFSDGEEAPVIPDKATQMNLSTADNDEIGFSLDFDMDLETPADHVKTEITKSSVSNAGIGFTLDDEDIGDVDFNADATQKTIVINTSQLAKSNLQEFKLDKTGSLNTSVDMMSSEEAKANIESTIKDILRPDFEGTTELEVSKTHTGLDDIEDSELDFSNTPSKGFVLSEIDEDAFSIDNNSSKKANPTSQVEEINEGGFDFDVKATAGPIAGSDTTGEFDINSLTQQQDESNEEAATRIAGFSMNEIPEVAEVHSAAPAMAHSYSAPEIPATPSSATSAGMGGATLNTEDSMRFQATIRALREEREEMLLQIKNLKNDSKELEQDNLTLKANLDEAKIEITILRKRHMVEIEDLKYRLGLSEEKKAMSDEKARQADARREKLEQKVRIDFNQVKQREKELESKLELLSMDVDSQVQSRDHKILELRRKIDALEFNMENASIKEQKSLDDKRKLEDRLNKIMKTLRHSIKNLEDDIDQVEEDSDHQKDKN